ncbi:replication restart helicase PriA [Daejeonella lutea]|uniref:Replication restart protein PriA n=1 Tax=Daejeonella lutea TaxID=572036 RepID=A0A1T5B827_9SPHI|nr:primosomal protein N' [Daejeonella lutea]SKB43376.1 replication restart DNA helicase PriA [Daejeonella lutea]
MLEFHETQDTARKTIFVEVILPLAISKTYTYRVPYDIDKSVDIGKRVVVQFGKSKIYTAIIYNISDKPPGLYEAKYIIDVLDEEPIVNHFQLSLWKWMSDYYLCHLGEVMQAALPAALKLASETKITLNQSAEFERRNLSDKEFLILDALEIHSELRVSDISKLLGQKTVFPLLRALFEKGIVLISEEISEKFKPRRKAFIILNPFYNDSANRKALFEVLERAPKQLELLLAYYKLEKYQQEIAKSDLIEASGSSAAVLKTLLEKEIFFQENKVISRLSSEELEIFMKFELNESQEKALSQVKEAFSERDVVLLYGETSSGKTQIYIRLIEQMLSEDRQTLYLLPEIALTTQVIERLREYFGNQVGIYHSKFNDAERAEVWQKVLKGEYKMVLGARSSIFLPFQNLGLIIVDEEHESSYKQYDPAPRYHARDTAIYLAHLHKAKIVLGSATPSLESFFNAKIKKYGFVTLKGRFGGVQSPLIEVVSIGEESKRKTMQSHFTSVLINEITGALSRKEQVILFQNRRGYTPVLLCTTCGYTPKCINCDVSLTFHKSSAKLHCHYCGYKQELLNACPACGSTKIEQKGFGTEKIEDELQLLFENARIARMDLDSTRSRNSFQLLLNNFEEGRIDILVGTQMVAKGLDFGNVTTIGIVSADSMLKYPDFRAFERSFQMLSQVSGRAGRRSKQGKVIIQAYDTSHRVISQVVRNDYEEMFDTEILERRNFHYPPIYRLIQLDVKHKDFTKLLNIATSLAGILRLQFADRILGPEAPLIGRIRNYYIQTILIKVEKEGVSIQKIKDALRDILATFEADPANKGAYIQIDVDPY